MNHLINLPTQFPKRIGIIIMILLVYLILIRSTRMSQSESALASLLALDPKRITLASFGIIDSAFF